MNLKHRFCLILLVPFIPYAQALQAAGCNSLPLHHPGMGVNIGFGYEAQQVRRSASGIRYFGGMAQRTEEVDRTVRGLMGCAPVRIGRAVQLSLRANSRPRSR